MMRTATTTSREEPCGGGNPLTRPYPRPAGIVPGHPERALLDLLQEIIRVFVVPRCGHVPGWLTERLAEIERMDERTSEE